MNYARAGLPPAALLTALRVTTPADLVLEALAQYCGATVVYAPQDGCVARLVSYRDRAIITVDARVPRPRQRFSIAHELGHWMRDRGQRLFLCTEAMLLAGWADLDRERRANRYAAELLLPAPLFDPAARGRPTTLASARALAETFTTSLTATAVRLVERGADPAFLVYTERGVRRWFTRSAHLPGHVWPAERPRLGAVVYELARGVRLTHGPVEVDAAAWFDVAPLPRRLVLEDSLALAPGRVLSVLAWPDYHAFRALLADLQV